MQSLPVHRFAPPASALASLIVDERARDVAGIAIPRPEVRLVVRYGPAARDGLDVHAMGVRQKTYRKVIRGGQRTLIARLHFGSSDAVLGVPASEIAGRTIAIEELWGHASTQRLYERLASAGDNLEAAIVLESTIAERFARADGDHPRVQLALEAANRLARTNVNAVADELGVSERKLRRVFHETFGMGPKAYATLARFQRALSAARANDRSSWASIAAAAGYYDQAHLIAEFRAIAGVTPRALMHELRSATSIG